MMVKSFSNSDNKFKIGIFAANCSGGIACTTIPERWEPTWKNNLEIATMADNAGLEFMLPLGRWAGYGGITDHNGISFETITWASGLLASTSQINVYSTVHVGLINPVFAAKQIVTADHIGHGRVGVNIVCGWNPDEYGMFGVNLGAHGDRYDLGQEWLDIVKKIWTSDAPFNFAGKFFKLQNVRAEPGPLSFPTPKIMSAGVSNSGVDFAIINANFLFSAIQSKKNIEKKLKKLNSQAKKINRAISVLTNAYVVCRPTEREAHDYHRYYASENSDDEAVETIFVGRGIKDNPNLSKEEKLDIRFRIAAGNSAYGLIGTPDQVVNQMEQLSDWGFSGIAMGLVNYTRDFPYFASEVIPRLEKIGLRKKFMQ